MNRQIRSFGLVMMAAFAAVFIQLNNLTVISAERLRSHPANSRTLVRDFSGPRGAIRTADGVVLADSVPSEGEFARQRRYPQGPAFAPVTGFLSFNFGMDGLESFYNDTLTGRDRPVAPIERIDDLITDRSPAQDVVLSLSAAVQTAALGGLAGRRGSVVALDPRTGAIRALASVPSFDPNALASHSPEVQRQAWESLNRDPDRPLRSRSVEDRLFPGSSFKVVTAAAALATGKVTPTQPSFPVLRSLPLPQAAAPLGNFGGSACGGSLTDALRVSCNTVFAQLGLDLGPEPLLSAAEGFGFNSVPPLDLPSPVISVFPPVSAFARDRAALARSAIGQQDVSATPLQMALVAAGVANRGVVMEPHLLDRVIDATGATVSTFEPRPWRDPAISPAVARDLTAMMVEVVQTGSGVRARIPGIAVAGKTGTAQTGRGRSHAWFVAFAPAEAPRVAVAVVLEDVPPDRVATGGNLAAPIARSVMEAALEAGPTPVRHQSGPHS
ncbi:MAG: peptidoglycan D,D-transpeptidase FtsI family protein [Acidimicrobiales bacterium]